MGKRLDTRLSEEDRLALEHVVKKSPDWRARERDKTLLLLSQPLFSREVAKVQELNIETVRVTWQRWVKEGKLQGMGHTVRLMAVRYTSPPWCGSTSRARVASFSCSSCRRNRPSSTPTSRSGRMSSDASAASSSNPRTR